MMPFQFGPYNTTRFFFLLKKKDTDASPKGTWHEQKCLQLLVSFTFQITMRAKKVYLFLLLVLASEILFFTANEASPWWSRRRRRWKTQTRSEVTEGKDEVDLKLANANSRGSDKGNTDIHDKT